MPSCQRGSEQGGRWKSWHTRHSNVASRSTKRDACLSPGSAQRLRIGIEANNPDIRIKLLYRYREGARAAADVEYVTHRRRRPLDRGRTRRALSAPSSFTRWIVKRQAPIVPAAEDRFCHDAGDRAINGTVISVPPQGAIVPSLELLRNCKASNHIDSAIAPEQFRECAQFRMT